MARSTAGKTSLDGPTTNRANIIGMHTCRMCGSLVDDTYSKEHSEMHKFMIDVVKTFENHAREILRIKNQQSTI